MSQLTLKVSYPPYFRSKDSIEKVMYYVAIALIPATISSVYFFGLRALWLSLVSIVACVGFEWMVNLIRKKEKTCFDGSAVVTGLLLALNVPSGLPYWMMVLGAFVAIVITKQLFGGLGYNLFNPALVARVFLLISFPVAMTSWPQIMTPDMTTAATPLGLLKTEGIQAVASIGVWKAFLGQVGGSIGETSALAVLLGAVILFVKRYITFAIPVSFLLTTFVFTGIFNMYDSSVYASPMFHMVTGGLMIGVFFMATDMVTSPISVRGQIIFGIGCGLLTGVIRLFGGYPEGVSFAILIMNAVVPLIDKLDLGKKKMHAEGK